MRDIQWEALREYYRALLAEQYAQLKEIFQTGALPQGFYGKLVEDGIRLGETLVFRKGESLEEYLIRTDRFRTRKYPMPVCNFVDLDGNWEGKAPLDGTPVPRIGKPRWTTSSRSFPRGRAGGRGLSYLGKFMFHVKLTSQAVEQIQEIITYISQDLLEHEVAKRWADVLQRTIESLDEMPAPVSTD